MAVTYTSAFFMAFLLSLFLTPLVRRFALRYNFVARPKKDRWNKRVISICGGIAIYASFLAAFLLYGRGIPFFLPFAAGSTAIFFCGLIDDIFTIKPYSKLFVQIVISSYMYLTGVGFVAFPLPFLNFFLSVFWFVAIMNAFNLLDNMDGLCAGITAISCGLIFAYYVSYADYDVSITALLLGAAALGFLRYNFHPAKIFMGDCGSMFIGFVMAAVSVMGTWRGTSNLLITMAVPVLVLGVPVFDTILVTLTRRASGRHFYEGGKDHISHRLVILGMSEKRAVSTLYIISIGCGLTAFLYTKLNAASNIIIILAIALLLLFIGVFLSQVRIYSRDKRPNAEAEGGKNRIFLGGMIYHKQSMFEMAVDFLVISMSYITAYLLRYEGFLSLRNLDLIVASLPILIIVKLSFFYWFGLYKSVWQYIGLHDLFNIFKAVTFGCAASILALVFLFRIEGYSRTVFVIDWLALLIAVSGSRLITKLLRDYFASIPRSGRNIFIMGAGDAGEYLLRGLKYNNRFGYAVAGFLDDNAQKKGRKIHGVPILGTSSDMHKLVKKYKVSEVFVAIPSLPEGPFAEIKELCRQSGVECRKMSELTLW